MSKPWFAEGLIGRELGADFPSEVTAQINKVISENDQHTHQTNGKAPTVSKVDGAVAALAESMKDVSVGVKGVNGVGKAHAS